MRIAVLLATTTLLASLLLNGVASAATTTVDAGRRLVGVTRTFDGKFCCSLQGAPELEDLDREIRTFDPFGGTARTFWTGPGNPHRIVFTSKHLVVDTDMIYTVNCTRKVASLTSGDAIGVTEMGTCTISSPR